MESALEELRRKYSVAMHQQVCIFIVSIFLIIEGMFTYERIEWALSLSLTDVLYLVKNV